MPGLVFVYQIYEIARLIFGFGFRGFDVLARPSPFFALRINLADEARTATEIRDWGRFVEIYFRGVGGISRGKACFSRENDFLQNVTCRILREIRG
jgi:hypothetical protein